MLRQILQWTLSQVAFQIDFAMEFVVCNSNALPETEAVLTAQEAYS